MSAEPAATAPEDSLSARLIVPLVGIPALLWVTWLGGVPYALFVTGMVLLGLREYLAVLPKGGLVPRPLPVYAAALGLLAGFAYRAGTLGPGLAGGDAALFLLAAVVLLVMVLQTVEVVASAGSAWANLAANVVGVLWIAGFGGTFMLVRSAALPAVGPTVDVAFRLTVALYVAVWICDSLAYLIGRRFGQTRILPKVSPNKTVVGTLAGALGALTTMLLLGFAGWLPKGAFALDALVLLGLIVGLAGQMGDFAESQFKRDFGVKDTGTLLPGHGGVLDRFDSLLFVMPLTYLYIEFLLRS